MAADMPKSVALTAADAPAAATGGSSTAPKHAAKKHGKKSKKSTPAPSTTK